MPLSRRKLSEINPDFYCSIIGTCLSLEEARKLLQDELQLNLHDRKDYVVHELAVKRLASSQRFRNKIQSFLDHKYPSDIYRCSQAAAQGSLEEYWDNCFSRGDLSGAYWAVFTSGKATNELLSKVFGGVHMQSHLAATREREKNHMLISRQQTIAELQETIEDYRGKLADCRTEVKQQSALLRQEEKANKKIRRQLDTTIKELEREKGSVSADLKNKNAKLESKLSYSTMKNRQLLEEIAELRNVIDLKRNTETAQDDDAAALSATAMSAAPQRYVSCPEDCAFKDSCDLKSREILLVGGRLAMVPHCKILVESFNGSFSFHDGGKEHSAKTLKPMVNSADIVICAIDCVSHNAVHCVKNACADCAKHIVMLKSSAITSFRRELVTVASQAIA